MGAGGFSNEPDTETGLAKATGRLAGNRGQIQPRCHQTGVTGLRNGNEPKRQGRRLLTRRPNGTRRRAGGLPGDVPTERARNNGTLLHATALAATWRCRERPRVTARLHGRLDRAVCRTGARTAHPQRERLGHEHHDGNEPQQHFGNYNIGWRPGKDFLTRNQPLREAAVAPTLARKGPWHLSPGALTPVLRGPGLVPSPVNRLHASGATGWAESMATGSLPARTAAIHPRCMVPQPCWREHPLLLILLS